MYYHHGIAYGYCNPEKYKYDYCIKPFEIAIKGKIPHSNWD